MEAFDRTRSLAPGDRDSLQGLQRVSASLGMTDTPVSGASKEQVTDRARLQAMGCLQKLLSSRPEFTGRIAATAIIDEQGRSFKVELDEDTIRSPELEACVIWPLRSAHWPKGQLFI